jgi:hypothetical protein
MLTQELIGRLSAAGVAGSVVGETSVVPARYVLEGTVTALYGDYTSRAAPQAVVTLRISVLDDSQVGSCFRRSTPPPPPSSRQAPQAWSRVGPVDCIGA